MNLGQLRTATYERLGTSASDPFVTATVVNDAINEALQAVATEHNWPWLQLSQTIVTVNGTDTYAPPATWMRTTDLRSSTTGDGLTERDIGDLEERWPPTLRGEPQEFAISSDQIVLRPVPGGVYTLIHRYQGSEPALTVDANTPLMPSAFHSAVVEFATALCLRRMREEGRAKVADDAYRAWLARMLDNRRRWSGTSRIKVRPGGGL